MVAHGSVEYVRAQAAVLGQEALDRAQAEREAAAAKFNEEFERQMAEEEAAANTPEALAAAEAALLADAAAGKVKARPRAAADPGVSFLKRRLMRRH